MRNLGTVDCIEYRGIVFRRYPDSQSWSDRCYYVPSSTYRKQGVGRLHQEIWKDAHGPIPAGYHVHHKDHNPLNNALENLELLSIAEHHAHHDANFTPEQLQAMRRRSEHARRHAENWHKSPAGREWHRELARQSAQLRFLVSRVCEHCGKEYEADNIAGNWSRFCSNKCKTAARKASGVDDETRICAFCGKSFTIDRYSPIKTCSRKCGSGLRFNKPRP